MSAPRDEVVVAPTDPTSPAARSLIATHVDLANRHSPPDDVQVLDVDALTGDHIIFFGAFIDGELVGVAALHRLEPGLAEIKSMHTSAAARRRGVATALVSRIIAEAHALGARQLSLETGTMDAFAPARALYRRFGFEACPPYGPYVDGPHSTCMTLRLV